jgi:hypothetical protein
MMDVAPGRARGRMAKVEDFAPGGNQYDQHIGGSNEGGYPRGLVQPDGRRKVITCFNCPKPGHFMRDCRQKQYRQQGSSCTQQSNIEDDNTYVAGQIVNDCTTQQKAQDWLSGVAGDSDNIQDLMLCHSRDVHLM